MKQFKHIAFLCGHFNFTGKYHLQDLTLSGWEKQEFNEAYIYEQKKFFYHEFVDFCMANRPDSIHSYKHLIEQEISILLAEHEYSFTLKNIQIYIMPYNLLIYSIEIEINTDDLNYSTKLLSNLRGILYYKEQTHQEFIRLAITPITEIYSLLNNKKENISFDQIIENGNKLKVFQIINSNNSLNLSSEKKDILLFESGTLSPIGLYEKHDENGISTCYFEDVLLKNKISFYNNWRGLSLLDSFTILSEKAPEWLLNNWSNIYFKMIYIHGLFLKFYLFRLNIKFRKDTANIAKFEEELIAFESHYCFHKISYNFLPLEIYKSIDSGLEITEERSQLNHLIEVENQRREKKNDKKVNSLLMFLTLLTMLSTIWDSSCLFNEMYPYSEYIGSTIIGYKMVTLLLSLAIVITTIFIFKRKK